MQKNVHVKIVFLNFNILNFRMGRKEKMVSVSVQKIQLEKDNLRGSLCP